MHIGPGFRGSTARTYLGPFTLLPAPLATHPVGGTPASIKAEACRSVIPMLKPNTQQREETVCASSSLHETIRLRSRVLAGILFLSLIHNPLQAVEIVNL